MNTWEKTDDLQWVQKTEEGYHVVDALVDDTNEEEEESFVIKSVSVDFSDYDEIKITSTLRDFGYDSIEHAKEEYKEDYPQILAECLAESADLRDADTTKAKNMKELQEKLQNQYGILHKEL